jgi:5'-3' exonuclease
MGIPSYYRRLVDSVGGLVKPVVLGASTDYLWIDFNCIVYHCLRRPGAPVWTGLGGQLEYESALRAEVIKYVDYLVTSAGVKRGVGLAVDGVVPAAKRRQQRLRRAEVRDGGAADGWDTNAITPGTLFMSALMADLESWRVSWERRRPEMTWLVSPCTEPGEGEHKIMTWLRRLAPGGKAEHMVYGLDADLILLTLLTNTVYLPQHSFALYREEQVDGAAAIGSDGKEKLTQFSISALYNFIVAKMPAGTSSTATAWIQDYVFAMSLLGNDFVPCMASLSLKEEGHAMLLDMLTEVWRKGGRLVEDGNYSVAGWKMLMECVARDEQARIVKSAMRKKGMVAKEGMEPVEWFVEEALFFTPERSVNSSSSAPLRPKGTASADHERGPNQKEFLELRADWQDIMLTRFSGLRGRAGAVRAHITKEYVRGLEWIFYYYMHGLTPLVELTGSEGDKGLVLNFDWYYPSWIAPFAADLWRGFDEAPPTIFVESDENCSPEEQLALVLPERSWGLLADKKEYGFAAAGTEWFGKATAHASFGKRWKWECHLNMPSPLLRDLRRAVSGGAF